MTGFSCWLLPSFVPPKGLKLDYRWSWSSILLSMRRGRGTWYTTFWKSDEVFLNCRIKSEPKTMSLFLFLPIPTYHLTASRRAQGQVRLHREGGTCRIFHNRSSFLTPYIIHDMSYIIYITYHLTASRRAQGQVRQHQVEGTCRIFHSRSSFLTPGLSRSYLKTCAEQTQRNSLLFRDLLAAMSGFYKRHIQK